jgi:predicted SnoaL-like aldol condensation-catalyzing enzyme
MTSDPRTDLAAFIETALAEVCFSQEDSHPLEATIDRYFTPDYTQRTDGAHSDRNGFAAHIRALRAVAAEGTVKVSEAMREGDRIADRHEVTVTKRDGTTSRIEIYLFGELADDGRLRRVDEITRLVGGDENDAGLAKVR